MATTEERLAALETQLAKLTATTPTDYYMHAYSGEEIDEAVGRSLPGGEIDNLRPGVNLLDNWYFADPVNQRGVTSTANAAYGIDRWAGIYTVNGGIVFESSEEYMLQRFEDNIKETWNGQQMTFSCLTSDGLFSGSTFYEGNPSTQKYFFAGELHLAILVDGSVIIWAAHSNIKVLAAKLELGSVQTLAHQDEDGNWVLNDPPPNKALELAKCQRFYQVFRPVTLIGRASSAASSQFVLPLSAPMRITPSLSDTDGTNWRLQDASGNYISLTAVKTYSSGKNDGFQLLHAESNSLFTAGAIYSLIRLSSAGDFALDANL